MGGFSLWHWLIVGIVILLLFGKGRFSDMMGDVAKGVKAFKKGMTEEDDAPQTVKTITPALTQAGLAQATPTPPTTVQTTEPMLTRAPAAETRTAAEIIADHERRKAAQATLEGRPD